MTPFVDLGRHDRVVRYRKPRHHWSVYLEPLLGRHILLPAVRAEARRLPPKGRSEPLTKRVKSWLSQHPLAYGKPPCENPHRQKPLPHLQRRAEAACRRARQDCPRREFCPPSKSADARGRRPAFPPSPQWQGEGASQLGPSAQPRACVSPDGSPKEADPGCRDPSARPPGPEKRSVQGRTDPPQQRCPKGDARERWNSQQIPTKP